MKQPAIRTKVAKTRTIVAWVVIPAFLSMFVAEQLLESLNPHRNGPWPQSLPRPSLFSFLLWWRNISLLIAIGSGVISLPRWQALVGLSLTVAYTLYVYWIFVQY